MARPATRSSVGWPLRGPTALALALLLVLANVRPASAAAPTDGFVTGGGWISSPSGAYTADPTLAGRGTFGLVAKHRASGAADGSTEFQLHGAAFNFHAQSYDWLIVSGERARYGGTGTLAGRAGVFGFLVSVIDGDRIAKGLPDRFRIKVFDASGVLYDNQPGAPDDADATMALGEGSIVIHRGNTSTNRPPIADAGLDQTVAPGTLVTLDGSGSSDPDGDALTYAWTLITWPPGSAATLLGSATPTPHFTADLGGTYVVVLVVNDGIASSAPDEVVVTATNTPPVASDDAYSTNEDTALAIAAPGVLGNDTDAEGSPLSAALVSGPGRGTLTLGANGSFTYTPALNFFGSDTFTYRASDGTAMSAAATVTITVTSVNDTPSAAPDAYTTDEDTPLVIDAPGVLANDSDADGDALSATLVSGPAHGTVTLSANGSFAYTPAANFAGPDSFSYRASDGAATSATTTVTLTVSAVNDAPVAVDDTATTNEDTPVVIDVLANDSDVDGALVLSTVGVITAAAHGTMSVDSATGRITYTPGPNFNGSDAFGYQVCDGSGACDSANVAITVVAMNDAPSAAPDAYTTSEDTALVIGAPGVLGNDSDVEGGALSAALVSGPAHGTLTLNADGSFTYTPALNFFGADTFTYRASDGTAFSPPVTVTLTVTAVNDPPVGGDDAATTNEDTPVIIDVLANDSDIEGALAPSTVNVVTAATHGATAVDPTTGRVTYTPGPNFNGSDAFSYQICDVTGACDTASVAITVLAVNDPPVAANDAYSTNEDAALVIAAPGVVSNDTDVDSNALNASLVAGPAHGTLTLNADGSFTYTPELNFFGADAFTYRANDGSALSAPATVTLTVTAVNDAPVAVDDAATTNEDTSVVIDVLANDSDVDGPLAAALVSVVTASGHGATAVDPTTGRITYTPAANFFGNDAFSYQVCDSSSACAIASVAITVLATNDAPVAMNDAYTTNEDTTLVIGAPGLLTNDSDTDGDPLSASLVSGPTHGTLALGADGSFTYTPATNYFGSDAFTYRASDATTTSAVATVAIAVLAVNDPPSTAPDAYTTNEDSSLVVNAPGVLANDNDADGDALSAVLVSGPAHGTLTLSPSGAFTYTPVANFFGSDAFTYRASDGTATSAVATATITVLSTNDSPVAADDPYSTNEDTALVGGAPGVLGNDTDADGDALAASLVSGPTHGTLALNPNGSFTYTPALNFFGTDSFTYRASDGTAFSAPATVTITVSAVNDPPVATDDTATTNEDTPVSIDVLANDSDAEGAPAPASVSVTVAAAHGATAVDPATGRITYTPAANFHGGDTFSYQVCDGAGACATASVAVTVLAVNDPPTANAGNDRIVTVGQLVTLAGSGSDPDGDTITFAWTIVSAPAGSFVTLTDPSSATPSVTPDLSGLYRLQLTVTDPSGASSSDTVDVDASGVITLTPDPLNMSTNTTASLMVTLSSPAGGAGQTVGLATDSAIVTIPSSVLVPAGATSVSFDVTSGTTSGAAHITASATGFIADTATVNVAAGTLLLALEDELVGVGRSTNGTVTLFTPAPPGGTVVTLTIANTLIATVTPATVTIPAGSTLGSFLVNGVAVGQTTLTGTAPGYTPADASVTVTDALISIGLVPEFGPDETQGVPISLTKPAPPGGLTITLVTDDPSVAVVSPTVTVPQGQFLPPANPQVTGVHIGTTQITATAPGFAPDHRTVTVALALSFTPTTLALGAGETRNITLLLSHTAPNSGLTVQLSVDDTSKATAPATATFPAGQTSVVIPITGVATGSTFLRANSPGIAQATATIRVGAPINVANVSVGSNLQTAVFGTLGAPAPAGNLPVTFTSSDPTKVLVTATAAAAGSASITVSAAAGGTTIPTVYYQALDSSGTVQVTASAPGYTNGVSTVTLTPSGFWIFAPGLVQAFTTNSFAVNTNILVRSFRLSPTLQGAEQQELRGGFSVDLGITSTNTTVGTITTSPIVFQGGTGSQKQTQFDPLGPGVTTLAFDPPVLPGFSIPTNLGQTVTATVVAPNVKFTPSTTVSVGRDLQTPVSVFLESPPPGPVDIIVSVAAGDEGIVTLSKIATVEGTSSITFTGVTNVSQLNFFVQGRSLASTQLTGTAAGYNNATLPISVTPAGFRLFAPGIVQTFTTNSLAPNTNIFIRSLRLTPAPALQNAGEQEVRGGLPVSVFVTSSDTSVGVITVSPIVVQGGTGVQHNTQFDPLNAGLTTLAIDPAVPGFSIPSNAGQTVAMTVIAPKVKFGTTSESIGQELQVPVTVQLESAPPAPVTITVSVAPGDEGIVSLTKVRTAAGASSVTFTGVTTTGALTFWVQGRALGATVLTASAPAYTSATLPASVTPAGFWLFAPGLIQTATTNNFAPNSSLFVRAERLTSAFALAEEQEVRGGLTVNVNLTNTNDTVGTVGSPVVFAGGTGSTFTTPFDPQVVGTTTVTLTTPAGFSSVPVANRSVLVTVRAPEVRISFANVSSQRVGRDLQFAAQVTLENAPPEAVNVILTVASGGESLVTISSNQLAAGSNTIAFSGVTTTTVGTIYVQGRALGSTAVTGVAAGYNDANLTVAVDPSGFWLYAPGFTQVFTTTVGAANVTVILAAKRLDPVTLNMAADQEVRGGLTVNIPVTSSNTAVGVITTSPVVFQGGTGTQKTTSFNGITVGTTIVSIPAPVPGFSVPSNGFSTITFTVNP